MTGFKYFLSVGPATRLAAGLVIGLGLGQSMGQSMGQGAFAAEGAAAEGVSPQRLAAGEGDSAGPKAPTIKRGGSGFLNTKVIIGVLVVGATVAVVLEASGDDDAVSPSTTTN